MRSISIYSLFMAFSWMAAPQLGWGQYYSALYGSDYAGAAGIFNNPASTVNSKHKWDVYVLGVNATLMSNALQLDQFKFPNVDRLSPVLLSGTQRRWLHGSIDANLLTAQYQFNNQSAISASIRVRTLSHFRANSFELNDTITSLHQFLRANRRVEYVDITGRHGGWLELDLNYAKTIIETPYKKINFGATLQNIKGMSGAYVHANRISYLESTTAFDTAYTFTNGTLAYAYSANYDDWSPNFSTGGNIKQFVSKSPLAFGLSLGAEFLWFNQEYAGEENEPRQYNWKLGVSLMDIGLIRFRTSENTGNFGTPKTSLQDWQISNKIDGITDARGLRDSLATLFDTTTALASRFSMRLPTRLVMNADHYLGNHLFLNANLSLNLYSSSFGKTMNLRELSLLTITPRWETKHFGFFLPVQYTTQGQFWMGMAFKAGPLMMGIHDLKLFTQKNPMLNGGAYMMLHVYPWKERQRKSRYDCL